MHDVPTDQQHHLQELVVAGGHLIETFYEMVEHHLSTTINPKNDAAAMANMMVNVRLSLEDVCLAAAIISFLDCQK